MAIFNSASLNRTLLNTIFCSFGHKITKVLGMLIVAFSLCSISSLASAAIEVYEFNSPRQEAQYKGLIEEFRCPKCQNQNLAGSDSQISQDLKRKTYEMVMDGQSDAQIREYMYERYGDFISYKPPVRPSTWILWYFPPIFLLLVIIWWFWRSRTKKLQQQALDASGNPKSADKIQSDLTREEELKLKELLKQHSNDSK